MGDDLRIRVQVAQELLGGEMDGDGFAPCPGRAKHSGRTGRRDFCVRLDGAPTGTCFHSSCGGDVDAFNLELRRRIGRAESGGGPGSGRWREGDGVAPQPRARTAPKRPAFEPAKLAEFAGRCRVDVSAEWLRQRSPVGVPRDQGRSLAGDFLSSLYGEEERVLVFTKQWSQGDFEWGGGVSWRLGDAAGIDPVRSPLPEGGSEGVWFLCQPVTGEWLPNPYATGEENGRKLGRRHGGCVTAWRFMVLESDEADAALWLRALVQFPLAVSAVYTSGGRSIHALVRVDAGSKAHFDEMRDLMRQVFCPLGADPAAMTAVRLTRLPGMWRRGTRGKDGGVKPYPKARMQRLLWLNPNPPVKPILDLV